MLTGVNSYSGGTTIGAGTLAFANGQALGDGDVIVRGGTLLSRGSTSLPTSLGNDVTIADGATGTIAAASDSTLRLTGALGFESSNGTAVFGDANNTGIIETSFAGASVSGSNALRVAAGTLVDTNGGPTDLTALAGSTTVDANARLQYNGSGAIRNLQGAGTVASVGGLTLGGGTFSGTIEDGPLNLDGAVLGGTGSVVLSGNNSYAGGTSIASGSTLQVGAGGTTGTLGSGDVVDDGTLIFNRSDAHTVGNAIVGGGSLTQAGNGTLVLTSDNGYTGGTNIAAGTLQVGNGGTSGSLGGGAIVNNGALVFKRGGLDPVTVGDAIAGSGR